MAQEAGNNLTIGMAEVTVDGVKVGRQADAAVVSFEPVLEEIDLYTVPGYDQMLTGWNVVATITVDEESIEHYKMALPNVQDTVAGGLTDGRGMKRLRDQAKEVVIHPIDVEGDEFDITIFKAIPIGTVERTYGNEVAGYAIELRGLHKSGDYRTTSNYFRIGPESEPVEPEQGE